MFSISTFVIVGKKLALTVVIQLWLQIKGTYSINTSLNFLRSNFPFSKRQSNPDALMLSSANFLALTMGSSYNFCSCFNTWIKFKTKHQREEKSLLLVLCHTTLLRNFSNPRTTMLKRKYEKYLRKTTIKKVFKPEMI